MKWSIDFVVREREQIGPALKAKALTIAAEIARTEEREFGHADYVPDLERMAKSVQSIAAQLPPITGRVLVVNVLGEIRENSEGEVVGGGICVKIDLVRDEGQLEQAEKHAAEYDKAVAEEAARAAKAA